MNPLTQKPRQSIRKMHFGVRLGAYSEGVKLPIESANPRNHLKPRLRFRTSRGLSTPICWPNFCAFTVDILSTMI